ncbi:MAG: peroxiredoxin-like family protein [Solirubrobacteraceae bacterium]
MVYSSRCWTVWSSPSAPPDDRSSTATDVHPSARPGAQAPALELPVVGGESFRLGDRAPRLFTMLVFNRGLHCPVCRAQLAELDARFGELAGKGIDVVSISAETEDRATRMRDDWSLENVPLAYGLSETQMRDWGLFVSRAIKDDEPAVFNEPALFLIAPDGTVYYEAVLSMPAGRPRLDDLLTSIEFWTANDYPARGGS